MGAKGSLIALLILSLTLAWARSDRSIIPGKQVTEINFWNGFTGPDGRTMLELIRQFNESNPDVSVSMQRIAWGTFYNKLMVSAVDGRGPETFVLQSGLLPRMDRAGFLEDVTSMFDPALRADFPPALLQRVNFGTKENERLVGIPLDIWPQGMFCNAEMLIAAGFVNPDGSARAPANRDEFMRAVTAMKLDANNDGDFEQWGFGYGLWINNFMTLAPQFGGEFLDENGNPTLDHPGNVQALQFLQDLNVKYHLAPPPEGGVAGWVGFRQKRVALVFDGIYMLGDLKRLEGHPYFGAAIPQIGPKPGTLADSHVLCIRKGLKPEARKASERFIRFISDNSLKWADAGQVPARRMVYESEDFKKLKVQYAFSKQLPYIVYPPKTPSIGEMTLHVNLAVEKAIRGRETAAEALRIANEDYKRYLERDALEQATLKESK